MIEPKSMTDVAALMRQSLPAGMGLSEFGERIGWGRGSDEALERIKSITIEELEAIGLTSAAATQWALAYDEVGRLMPGNPSAAGRATLMRHIAEVLTRK